MPFLRRGFLLASLSQKLDLWRDNDVLEGWTSSPISASEICNSIGAVAELLDTHLTIVLLDLIMVVSGLCQIFSTLLLWISQCFLKGPTLSPCFSNVLHLFLSKQLHHKLNGSDLSKRVHSKSHEPHIIEPHIIIDSSLHVVHEQVNSLNRRTLWSVDSWKLGADSNI